MSDVRSTQEIFGDLFGGLASLGARGVDGLIFGRAVANLLIEKGIITRDELVAAMQKVIEEELGRDDNSTFLMETYQEIIRRLDDRE
jgi:hypothetical protein